MKSADSNVKAVICCTLLALLTGCDNPNSEPQGKLENQTKTIRDCVNDNLRELGSGDIAMKYFAFLTNQKQYYFTFQIDHDQDPKTDGHRYRAGLLSKEVIGDIQNNNSESDANLPPHYASASKYDDAIVSRILSGNDLKYDRELGFGYSNRLALNDQKSVVLTSDLYLIEFLNAGFRGDDMMGRIGAARHAILSLDSSIQKCLS